MLNIGAIILDQINESQTITMLWTNPKIDSTINSFEKFILGLDFLFMLGLIDYKKGIIRKTKT